MSHCEILMYVMRRYVCIYIYIYVIYIYVSHAYVCISYVCIYVCIWNEQVYLYVCIYMYYVSRRHRHTHTHDVYVYIYVCILMYLRELFQKTSLRIASRISRCASILLSPNLRFDDLPTGNTKNRIRVKNSDAKKHIIEKILTLSCPCCGQAFADFPGCCALTCSRQKCTCAFCVYCLQDAVLTRMRMSPANTETCFCALSYSRSSRETCEYHTCNRNVCVSLIWTRHVCVTQYSRHKCVTKHANAYWSRLICKMSSI